MCTMPFCPINCSADVWCRTKAQFQWSLCCVNVLEIWLYGGGDYKNTPKISCINWCMRLPALAEDKCVDKLNLSWLPICLFQKL